MFLNMQPMTSLWSSLLRRLEAGYTDLASPITNIPPLLIDGDRVCQMKLGNRISNATDDQMKFINYWN